jgi:hypothetical protein
MIWTPSAPSCCDVVREIGRRGHQVSLDGRGRTRRRILRRAGLIAGVLVLVALLLLLSGHWVLGVIFAVAAAVAIWVFLQARTVR